VGKGAHGGPRIDNDEVGPPNHDAQLHVVEIPGPQVSRGPRALVVQGADDHVKAVPLEHLHVDGPPVDRGLPGFGAWSEVGQGGGSVRHEVIVAR